MNEIFADKSKKTSTLTLAKCFAQMLKGYEKNYKLSWFYTSIIFSFKTDGFLFMVFEAYFIYILIISIPSMPFNYWFVSLFSKISIFVYLITVYSEECK